MASGDAQDGLNEEALRQLEYMRSLVEGARRSAAGTYPHLLMWGGIWIVGYLGSALTASGQGVANATISLMWVILTLGGAAGSTVIGMRARRKGIGHNPLGARLTWMNGVLVATAVVAPWILRVTFDLSNQALYIPAVVGVIYALNGIFIGRELAFVGTWIVLAAVVSRLLPNATKLVWMSLAGGGGLVVSGLLMRRLVNRSSGPGKADPAEPAVAAG